MGRYRVGVDDVLDRVAPVVRISGFAGASEAKGALTGCGPEREVSHAWQPLEAHLRQHVQPMRGRIEECAKDVRSCELELPPKRSLRPALPFGNRCEHQQDSAVRKIGTSNDLLDPVENDGSGGGKQNFVLIGEQPTGRKSTAARQTAEGVRQPGRQAAEIVDVSTNPPLPPFAPPRARMVPGGSDETFITTTTQDADTAGDGPAVRLELTLADTGRLPDRGSKPLNSRKIHKHK